MPQILVYLSEEDDEKVKELMREWNLSNKTDAVIRIVQEYLKKIK